MHLRLPLLALFTALALTSAGALAADPIELTLSASAQREVANDQISATLYVQERQASPAQLANRLNQQLKEGLAEARQFPAVTASSGSYSTWPEYDKNGRIQGWTGRAELMLKSRELTPTTELVARLQKRMLLEGVQFSVSDEARRATENQLLPEAIAALQAQAQTTARAVGRSTVSLKSLEVGQSAPPMVRPMMMQAKARMESAAADVAAPEWQPGRSLIQLQVNGKAELR